MQGQFDISQSTPAPKPASPAQQTADILGQILEVQKQTLAQLQAMAAAQDAGARWRALMAKWSQEYPELPETCRKALPNLERAYGSIIATLVEEIGPESDDSLENEFTLQEFIDKYGMRLGQLGNILNLVSPLADSNQQGGSS